VGVEIKVTDREFPVSPAFIEFLYQRMHGEHPDSRWHDQLTEGLTQIDHREKIEIAQGVAEEVMQNPLGQQAILRSYELFTAILTGARHKILDIQRRYQWWCVVGAPRHGGSYLTKHLFRALGFDPKRVPAAIAHDGFPEAAPFIWEDGQNGYCALMQQFAEYLTMAEIFFGTAHTSRIAVPKKATKAVYHGALFDAIFGPDTQYIITLRHPAAACVSTYEKSGGFPADGKIARRGNIEEWIVRDCMLAGVPPVVAESADYFDAYLRYWELYHTRLPATGLAANRNARIIVYGRERMQQLACGLCERLGSDVQPEEFNTGSYHDRHPDWFAKAEPVVRRVAAHWRAMGLAFPVDEVMEGW